jgi:hypothetical protein
MVNGAVVRKVFVRQFLDLVKDAPFMLDKILVRRGTSVLEMQLTVHMEFVSRSSPCLKAQFVLVWISVCLTCTATLLSLIFSKAKRDCVQFLQMVVDVLKLVLVHLLVFKSVCAADQTIKLLFVQHHNSFRIVEHKSMILYLVELHIIVLTGLSQYKMVSTMFTITAVGIVIVKVSYLLGSVVFVRCSSHTSESLVFLVFQHRPIPHRHVVIPVEKRVNVLQIVIHVVEQQFPLPYL